MLQIFTAGYSNLSFDFSNYLPLSTLSLLQYSQNRNILRFSGTATFRRLKYTPGLRRKKGPKISLKVIVHMSVNGSTSLFNQRVRRKFSLAVLPIPEGRGCPPNCPRSSLIEGFSGLTKTKKRIFLLLTAKVKNIGCLRVKSYSSAWSLAGTASWSSAGTTSIFSW
jgi:hypothetical protein